MKSTSRLSGTNTNKSNFINMWVPVRDLTVEKQLELAKKYIDPSRMYYVVAGDAKTQLNELEKVGLGKPILVKD